MFFLSFSSYISYIITKSISYIVCNSVYDSITDDELHYVDFFFRAWDWFLVILVLYTAWASPFEFGFLQTPRAPLSILDNVVNGFFAVDIVLTFFVAFLDKATYLLVDDPKRIAWRYTSTWLIFDVVSTVPYELFGSLLHNTTQGYGIFSMLRLWRLHRVSKCFAR